MTTVAAQLLDFILVDMENEHRETGRETSGSVGVLVIVRGLVGCLMASNYFFTYQIGGNIHKPEKLLVRFSTDFKKI
jgi:hypothetical protein